LTLAGFQDLEIIKDLIFSKDRKAILDLKDYKVKKEIKVTREI
jgi:hypothetical protein